MVDLRRLLLFLVFLAGLRAGFCQTNSQDAAALQSLSSQWQNLPSSWGQSNDPCGTPWDGIICSNGRVTSLRMSTMSIKGQLSGDIGQLTELVYLDLSFNPELGGSLTSKIGNLKQLTTLILAGCSFSGTIPQELGNLAKLSFMALNSNRFTGKLPASLGLLSNLLWFDVADNQLTGSLPISSSTSPGFDQLVNTQHFHFNKNNLSGPIPEQLFSSNMTLIHILFDGNQFTGPIPNSIGLVKTLEVLRLDRNLLNGSIPTNITNLTDLNELNLANNKLSGPVPNLSGLVNLNYVDLSNNTFNGSPAPAWFSTLTSIRTIVMENSMLSGQVPEKLFALPQLQQVTLKRNAFNGTLNMSGDISPQLQSVDLQTNQIIAANIASSYKNTIILVDNPVCLDAEFAASGNYCTIQKNPVPPYSTSLDKCVSKSCSSGSLNPQSCDCTNPYQGMMIFRAPFFSDLTNSTLFKELESTLWTKLSLSPGYVYISDLHFNSDKYLELQLKLFPSTGLYFNRSEIQRIGYDFSSQTYKPPPIFGPYFFIGTPYFQDGTSGKSSMSTGAIVGIVAACAILLIGLIVIGLYALRQKRRAERAREQADPFASWGGLGKDTGEAPKLKGARWFPFDEVKKCTNNFSEGNEIGSGGFGKVYRGMLSNGQMVAIKRAQQGSMQGGLEFKTEIELMSRVHHKNLVSLVGFCFEQGEQMLVYEYIPNGTLRENLIGRGGMQLDWKKRLKIALGSARGLAYLHELADPPIIHRDVKSTNILLDDSLSAKVADFGLSKLLTDSQKGHVSTQVKGTLGYLDPEYYMTQQLSDKSDVYSFGVVMLEMISARQPIEKGKYIVREVRAVIDKYDQEYYGLRDIIDPVIRNHAKLIGFRRFVQLAMECVEESAADRPTMNEVVKELEIMLQNEGVSTTSNSASSSATDYGITKGPPRHPYEDQLLQRKEESSSAFDYSGGYSAKIEPK
ncbi:leucine-rich repeat receptor protein kinase HPCA1-like [Typha latifolia]|uniref:leucine-rich repeat receptor protein kinase HPCA1-like n=1 Tax=Typha latifolia TaxID=4733 RepID=UPI003C2BCE63